MGGERCRVEMGVFPCLLGSRRLGLRVSVSMMLTRVFVR